MVVTGERYDKSVGTWPKPYSGDDTRRSSQALGLSVWRHPRNMVWAIFRQKQLPRRSSVPGGRRTGSTTSHPSLERPSWSITYSKLPASMRSPAVLEPGLERTTSEVAYVMRSRETRPLWSHREQLFGPCVRHPKHMSPERKAWRLQ
jgi:hypothetical protein